MTQAAQAAPSFQEPGQGRQGLTRRRAETRERLMDAAITVFARDGVDQARLEDISEAAGYTRGAFYSNFADKDALIAALLERQFARATDLATTSIDTALAMPGTPSFPDRVSAALDGLADCIPDDEWLIAERSMHLYAMRNPAIAEPLMAYEGQHRAAVGQTLERGLTLVGLRSAVPIDQLVIIIESVFVDAKLRERIAAQGGTSDPELARDLVISLLARCLEPAEG